MGKSTTNVECITKRESKKDGFLRIRITTDRKHKYKNLGINILKSHWDKDNQRVLPSNKMYKLFNEKIIASLEDLERANYNIQALNVGNTIITEYWEKHNKTTTNVGTLGNRRANLAKFKSFLKDENIEALKFSDLTPHIVELYENFLTKQLAKRSVNTYLGYFKSVVNKAIKHQIVSYRVFPFINHTRLTNPNKKARALTMPQIKQLIGISLTPRNDYYRQMFLFQILGGGLRVRDLIFLRWENIEINEGGIYLHYTQSKTNKEIKTKLSYKALEPLTSILHDLAPNQTQTVVHCLEMLNSQIALKEIRKSDNKYSNYKNENVKEYTHYDLAEKRNYSLDEINKSQLQAITLDQNIKMYLQDLNYEYTILLNYIIKEYSNDYIFKLMKGIITPKNNTDSKIKNKIQGKISIYNYHLNKICKLMEIPTFTSHTARHTFAQVLVNSNTNLFYIQQFLGHSSLGVTQNYIRSLDNTQLDEVSDTLAKHF